MSWTRRDFLQWGACLAGSCLAGGALAAPVYRGKENPTRTIEGLPRQQEVLYTPAQYGRGVGPNVQCVLCPKYCIIPEGKAGWCRVRVNRERKLQSTVYAQPCSIALHPMEQGPIFHAYPGARCLAIAAAGCNLRCKYCQNWQMSQFGAEDTLNYYLEPAEAVQLAIRNNCQVLAFTYTEPVVYAEYVMDVALEGKQYGLKSVLITAGFVDPEPMRDLCEVFDVVRVDLKGFREDFYEKVAKGRLQPVLDAIEVVHSTDAWLEIVDPIVPRFNDKSEEIRDMAQWILDHLGDGVPVHFLRFFPAYKMRNFPRTPDSTLERVRDAALETGLKFVYLGNMPGHEGENTFCPRCNRMLIHRIGYLQVEESHIKDGACAFCGEPIPGRWDI